MRTRTNSNKTRSSNSPTPAPVQHRHWISDWTIQCLILLFGAATVVQAFVVPTGSMSGTVLIGDHVLVDKLAYAPPGSLSKYVLPYQDIRRGDIIVFRYPLDLKQNYVKRIIGLPGDRVRFEKKQLILNGTRVREPYLRLDSSYTSDYLNNFPRDPDIAMISAGWTCSRATYRAASW